MSSKIRRNVSKTWRLSSGCFFAILRCLLHFPNADALRKRRGGGDGEPAGQPTAGSAKGQKGGEEISH